MKKINTIITVLIFQSLCFAQQGLTPAFANAVKAGMDRRADIFENMQIKTNGCIEFVGGSIMEDCEWSELFKNPNIINRGIDGNTTVDVLNRMDELTRHKTLKFFLEIGTSDLNNGAEVDSIMNNIQNIIYFFCKKNPNTKFYVFSILPPGIANPSTGMVKINNEEIVVLNNQIKLFCKKKKLTYVDLYSSFLGEDIYLNTKFGNSNSKLTVAGYLLLKNLIIKYVND